MGQKGYWVPANIEDVEEHYTFEAHKPKKLLKSLPWLYCPRCGLMYLNNRITKWCIKMGCNHDYHHQYKRMLKSLTGRT